MSQFAKHTSGPIDSSNPWSDDVLKRRELAEQLTAALSTVTQPFVLGLHGEFGNGKTFFIKRWRQELLNAGDVAVYFNAWETDYAAEPLIAFTAAIKKQLEEHDLGAGNEAKALATSAGRIVLKAVLPRAISLATGGLVQASDVSALVAIGDQIAGAASDIADRAVEEAVRHYEEARDEVGRFCLILGGCAQAITERETGRVRRLIIFVDELDRCRPNYAVQVLECIKHFFAVDHVIFVIAIDRDALTESIRAVYGDGINVDGYIRKFFDYHVELRPADHHAFAHMLARSFRLDEAVPSRLTDWLDSFPSWCRALSLSLRVQEQILSQANFLARTYGPNTNWFIYDLILFSLCVRAKDAELFNRIAMGELGLQHLLTEVGLLVDRDTKDDDRDLVLRYGVQILLAGFVSPEARRAEHTVLENRLKALQSENLPAGEPRILELEGQIDVLDRTFRMADRHSRPIGPRIVRRMRFLTD